MSYALGGVRLASPSKGGSRCPYWLRRHGASPGTETGSPSSTLRAGTPGTVMGARLVSRYAFEADNVKQYRLPL